MSKLNHRTSTSENLEKFKNFVHTFGATRLLLQRAHEQGFLIEGLVLYASLTDGLCRICLILKEQIKNGNATINPRYIYQNDDKLYFTERKIYKLVRQKNIIESALYHELDNLYSIRNKFIHRFFISEIEYSHLEVVCTRYERVYQQLLKITHDLETEQITQGVGMTISGNYTPEDESEIKQDIYKKIKTSSERNLAKTLDCSSVEEIIEFSSKSGLINKCGDCGHMKIEHVDIKAFQEQKDSAIDLDCYINECRSKNCSCKQYR
ncbi:MAG: hypothetical protein RIG61_01470 [Deltaproteobacteria bacterium]